MTEERKTGHNTGFASGGVTCKLGALYFYLSSVHVDSFVLRNPPERKAPKRYAQFIETFTMTIIKSIGLLFLLCLMLLLSCRSHYVIHEKIYFRYPNENIGMNEILISEADNISFKKIRNSNYAVDKNYVYFRGTKILNANPNSFELIATNYCKDDKFVFIGTNKINGADPQSFELLKGGFYSKDKKNYYFKEIPLNVTDLENFQIIVQNYRDGFWAKDKTNYYIEGNKFSCVDCLTFEKLEGTDYAKDRLQVYFKGNVVTDADPQSFEVIAFAYGRDKKNIYFEEKKLNIKDPKSFQILRFGFMKDNKHIYYNDSIVVNADPESFHSINYMWAKDKNSIYYFGHEIKSIDYLTFRSLNYGYAMDEYNVYFHEQIISNADPKTFIQIKNTNYFKDKNAFYLNGKRVNSLSE